MALDEHLPNGDKTILALQLVRTIDVLISWQFYAMGKGNIYVVVLRSSLIYRDAQIEGGLANFPCWQKITLQKIKEMLIKFSFI
jgi:hypothetical protein